MNIEQVKSKPKKKKNNSKNKNLSNPTKSTKPIQKKAPKVSKLNSEMFVAKASNEKVKSIKSDRLFTDLNLHSQLQGNIDKMGFTAMTEIQDKSFEQLFEGENIIGIANTGTGKTGAFLIPILDKYLKNPDEKKPTIIIVPTRELALQVYDEFKKLALSTRIVATCFIGGTNIEKDMRTLRNHSDIVIGTPGRLLDLKNRDCLKLTKFEVLILDEFDKMLDMGFIQDIRKLISHMKNRKQTILFSATKAPKQQKIIDEIVQNPYLVEIHSGDQSSKNVEQDIIKIGENEDKFKRLLNLLEDKSFDKIILFTETKHLANRISKKLNSSGVTSDQIHGNKSQNYRINALNKFKKGEVRVLVATDVAARGIDIDDVSLVINYQKPMDYDTYIHRVGRTGRAGKSGKAITFVD